MRSRTLAALTLAACLSSCTGQIGPGVEDGDGPEPNPQDICSDEAPLIVPMQRITAPQFEQVMTELFGEGLDFGAAFPSPLAGYAYSTDSAANPVADAQVKPIMEAVEAIRRAGLMAQARRHLPSRSRAAAFFTQNR